MAHKLTLLILALVVAGSAIADRKPTRSECIIGYALDWTGVKTDAHQVRLTMSDWFQGHEKVGSLAGMTMKPDGSRLYLQYGNRCENKQQMATNLIEYWRSQELDLPAFERLPDPITPSPHTIDLKGPDWRDSETPFLELPERSSDSI